MKKNVRIREIIERERRYARRWLKEASAHLAMAEDNLQAVRAFLKEREKPTSEERALLRQSVKLVEDARKRKIYYEGVAAGMAALAGAISKRMIIDELDPFGHFGR